MATATTLLGYTLTNLGPLTTTFTAPPACTTANVNYIELGLSATPTEALWYLDCDFSNVDYCMLPGPLASDYSVNTEDYTHYSLPYFSPGVYCPSGWTTVGVASRDSQGSIDPSGAFVVPSDAPAQSGGWYPPEEALMQNLGPKETALACCPSSMTPGLGMYCYQTLPSYSFSSACNDPVPPQYYTYVNTTFTLDNLLITTSVVVITANSSAMSFTTTTTSFSPNETQSYMPISVVPMVALVQQPTATDTPAGNSSTVASPPPQAQRLSNGAKVGIAIGATAVVFFFLALFRIWMVIRRRGYWRPPATEAVQMQDQKLYVPVSTVQSGSTEMPTSISMAELPGEQRQQIRHELDAS